MSRGRKRLVSKREMLHITVVLPPEIIEAADRIVTDRKRGDRGFNRSALVQEALANFMPGVVNE